LQPSRSATPNDFKGFFIAEDVYHRFSTQAQLPNVDDQEIGNRFPASLNVEVVLGRGFDLKVDAPIAFRIYSTKIYTDVISRSGGLKICVELDLGFDESHTSGT
jgi:hypothetical protein